MSANRQAVQTLAATNYVLAMQVVAILVMSSSHQPGGLEQTLRDMCAGKTHQNLEQFKACGTFSLG